MLNITHGIFIILILFDVCKLKIQIFRYVIRAVYVAKGSPLLPPAIASVFDDAASSVLDVFFDPSSGSIGLPGITLGWFRSFFCSSAKKILQFF